MSVLCNEFINHYALRHALRTYVYMLSIFSPVSQGKFNTFCLRRQATEWVAQSAKNDEGSMTMIFLESLKFANVRWTVAAVAWHAVVVALSFPHVHNWDWLWLLSYFRSPVVRSADEHWTTICCTVFFRLGLAKLAAKTPRCSNDLAEKSQHFT